MAVEIDDLRVRVRFEQVGNRLQASELRLFGAITSDGLRAVPLRRIEGAANTTLRSAILEAIDRPMPDDVDLLATGIRAYEPGRDLWREFIDRRRARSLRIPGAEEPGHPGRKRPDAFYRHVAELWGYVERTDGSAEDLAAANDVPASTIYRWVKEARRRGFLPAAKQREGRSR